MLLTIGMIVKNEEEHLERCLMSLEPIRKAVDTELIIVDTGSTDSTVEIARKYTNIIRHFKWCNNFSAARNESLKGAKGEWFMFIDADEWFDDCSEIVEFFTSGDYKNYTRAEYIVRNYIKADCYTQYTDCVASRLTKILPNTQFINIIHEALNTPMDKIKSFSTFAHHFGYVELNAQEDSEKRRRNIALLEQQIAKNGKNYPLSYLQLYDMYLGTDAALAEKVCRDGLKANNGKSRNLDYIFIKSIAAAWYLDNNYDKAISAADEYFALKKARHELNNVIVTDIDMYGLLLVIYSKTDNLDMFIKNADKYIMLYNQYKMGMHHTPEIRMTIPMFVNEHEFVNNNCIIIERLISFKKFDEARKYLKNTPYKYMIEQFGDRLVSARLAYDIKIACELTDYSIITDSILQIEDDTTTLKLFEDMLIKQIVGEVKDKKGFIEYLYKETLSCNVSDVYLKAVTMYYMFFCDAARINNNSLRFIDDMDIIHVGLSDLLYFVLKFRLPYQDIIHKMNACDFAYYYNNIHFKKNFAATLVMYLDNVDDDLDCYAMLWFSELILFSVTNTSAEKAVFASLLRKYADYMYRYMCSVYQGDMINHVNISCLPDIVSFGFFVRKALKAVSDNTDFDTICAEIKRCIGNVSAAYDMAFSERLSEMLEKINPAEAVSIPVKNDVPQQVDDITAVPVENAVMSDNSAKTEFEVLSEQVKHNIRLLISQEKFDKALSLIDEYAEINPSDVEIDELKKAAGMTAEVVQEIPQNNDVPIAEKTEFELLGEQVKENIRMFIAQGKISDSVSLINEYAEINPSDVEIDELKKAAGMTAEVVQEIVPQNNDVPSAEKTEFEILSEQVKQNIRFLISQGKITDAIVLIKDYEAVNPTDSEIPVLKNEIFK